MKVKLFGIFVCVLLLILSLIPALKSDYNSNDIVTNDKKLSTSFVSKDKSYDSLKQKKLFLNNQEPDPIKDISDMSQINNFLTRIYNFKEGASYSSENNFQNNIKSDNELDTLLLRKMFKLNSLQEDYNIKGYVTDNSTNQPIYQAGITLFWQGNRESIDRQYTESDSEGFYNINAEIGRTWGSIYLLVKAPGYYDEVIIINDNFKDMGKNNQLWYNVSLIFGAPPENSIICGYLTDMDTNEPIENAEIYINSYDYPEGYNYWNFTQTNPSGFFKINVAVGNYDLLVHSDDYYYRIDVYDTDFNIIEENEVVWFNNSYIARPQASANIHGEVTDDVTGDPIENVFIIFIWFTHFYQIDIDWKITDSSGRYMIDVTPGYPPLGMCEKDNYFTYDMNGLVFFYEKIKPAESIKKDISLQPYPPDSAVVNGYVKDYLTLEPLIDAEIHIFWHDYENDDYYISKSTYTGSSGFYSVGIPAGKFQVYYYDREGKYFDEHSYYHDIVEGQTLTIDLYPYPYPEEKSIVCGYITDETTNDPISKAQIHISWKDDMSRYRWNSTNTDSTGFYKMDCAAGKFGISSYASQYFGAGTQSYSIEISDYETIWVNLSMKPYPPENSIVKGYVKDNETNEPIKYAMLDVSFHCEDGRYYKFSIADSSGFFSINAPAVIIGLTSFYEGYLSEEIVFDIEDYQTYWINISIDKFRIKIKQPVKSLYINNRRILPFLLLPIKNPIIVGNIEIKIEGPEDVYMVWYFIDDELKHEGRRWDSPLNWTWDKRAFGKYELKVIAFYSGFFSYSIVGAEKTVWKFF